jgi:NADH-quinone oxidoreductase subunit C
MGQATLTQQESEILQALTDQFGDAVTGHEKFEEQFSIFIDSAVLFELSRFMREDEPTGFDLLADICGVDWINQPEKRFELVYNFYSVKKNLRVLIRTFLPDSERPSIRSIQPVYSGADWLEREVYDMLGIEFEGHPDLRRIITPDGFEGWPHRKDFPLTYEAPNFSFNKDNPPEIIK